MIIDRVENAHLYLGIGTHIDIALKFIETADLSSVTNVILDDGNVRINSIEYVSRPVNECNKENHIVDADIHVCVDGIEVFGYASLKDAIPVTDYNADNDKRFYDAKMNYVRLLPGMFALVFPEDVHSAMMADSNPAPAKKIVIKCKI
jgi:YhcH/YjgK/YiaL family protein